MKKGETSCGLILELFQSGMSYTDIALKVGRQKRSVIRTVKAFGLTGQRDGKKVNADRLKNIKFNPNKLIVEGYKKEQRDEIKSNTRYESLLKNKFCRKKIDWRKKEEAIKKDPNRIAKRRARQRVKNFLKQRGLGKWFWSNGGSVSKWTGCTGQELREHLEKQFRDGMTWDNRGTLWEIDHIIPLASADLSNASNVIRLSHYTNLQPLLKHENRVKGDKHFVTKCL